MSRPTRLCRFALLALLALPSRAEATWPHDPLTNVPVCVDPGTPGGFPAATFDNAGGAIIAWGDARSGAPGVYVQRLDAAGTALWTPDGVALSAAIAGPVLVLTDGGHGAFIAWTDGRDGLGTQDVFVQHVDGSGTPTWTAGGLRVCTGTGRQDNPVLLADGEGGCILAWQDLRSGDSDIYAQHVSAGGARLWAAGGVPVCTVAGAQSGVAGTPDGLGGAVFAWTDQRGATFDIYAQAISSGGIVQYTAGGSVVCDATGDQGQPRLVLCALGGVIVVWTDKRGIDQDLYAQRLTPLGDRMWAAPGYEGVPVCDAPGVQQFHAVASDYAGGVIVTWQDGRILGGTSVYAQLVRADGALAWPGGTDGLAVGLLGSHAGPVITPDNAGGAVISWSDNRTDTGDIYAQRIDATGTPLWTVNGAAVCTATGSQFRNCIASDGGGGAIVAWIDGRTTPSDLYAQRIEEHGLLGDPAPRITSVADVPNDQGGSVTVSWLPSYLDAPDGGIVDYRIWRMVPPFGPLDPIATLPATMQPGYALAVPTTVDSVAPSDLRVQFMVEARRGDGAFWDSPFDSGFSIDNLAPATPQPLSGTYAAGTALLHWAPNPEPDLASYSIYRGADAGFVPGPSNLLATTADTALTDPAGTPMVYKVTARDVHGNESAPAVYDARSTTGVAEAGRGGWWLGPPAPNPAGAATVLRFALPARGPVRIGLYDVAGRLVHRAFEGNLEAGEQARTLEWGGRNALPSGLYLVRLEAGGRALTRRLAILR